MAERVGAGETQRTSPLSGKGQCAGAVGTSRPSSPVPVSPAGHRCRCRRCAASARTGRRPMGENESAIPKDDAKDPGDPERIHVRQYPRRLAPFGWEPKAGGAGARQLGLQGWSAPLEGKRQLEMRKELRGGIRHNEQQQRGPRRPRLATEWLAGWHARAAPGRSRKHGSFARATAYTPHSPSPLSSSEKSLLAPQSTKAMGSRSKAGIFLNSASASRMWSVPTRRVYSAKGSPSRRSST